MDQEPKKHSSIKTKIIIALILVLLLIGIGIYLGMRFQNAYNRFLFRASQSMIGFSFWAVIILAAILVIYIVYLVFKMRNRKGK